jgi:hypothetical protein
MWKHILSNFQFMCSTVGSRKRFLKTVTHASWAVSSVGKRQPVLGRDHFSLIKVMFGSDDVHISRLWKSWLLHQSLQCYPPTSIF